MGRENGRTQRHRPGSAGEPVNVARRLRDLAAPRVVRHAAAREEAVRPNLVRVEARWDRRAKERALKDVARLLFDEMADRDRLVNFMAAWWLSRRLLAYAEVIRA